MLLILSEEINPRIEYVFSFIFKTILNTPYSLTIDKSRFLNFNGPKFSYGKSSVDENTMHFSAVSLLFEEEITPVEIRFTEYNNSKVFFDVEGSVLPFDLFAACFYLLSRYEEYLPHEKDKHRRFQPEQSVSYNGGFLEKPVINIWISWMQKILAEAYPELVFGERNFSFLPTIDIDNAYAFKNKGFVRSSGQLVKQLLTLQFSRFYNRIQIYLNLKQDPYDSYLKQKEIHERYLLKPLYFILIGDRSRFDRSIHYKKEGFRKLIKDLDQHAEVAIHPSYRSNKEIRILKKEKSRLEEIIGRKIVKSRQHYIKLRFPDTYRNLLEIGFTNDYSMGYPSRSGFRAGTCDSFYFFDLEKNKTTSLLIHPFVIMDTTLKVYQRIKSKDVRTRIKPIIDEVKKVNGRFIFIFHNESIGGRSQWKNWSDMYEEFIKMCQEPIDD